MEGSFGESVEHPDPFTWHQSSLVLPMQLSKLLTTIDKLGFMELQRHLVIGLSEFVRIDLVPMNNASIFLKGESENVHWESHPAIPCGKGVHRLGAQQEL